MFSMMLPQVAKKDQVASNLRRHNVREALLELQNWLTVYVMGLVPNMRRAII